MHEYDTALKDLLTGLARLALRELTGVEVTGWRDVELPEVSNPRMDLLGETGDGSLIHIELQSTNDELMAVRMADYGLRVYRQKRVFPMQFVLYVGDGALRMSDRLELPRLSFQYRLVDIRDLDGEKLLDSDAIGDNIIAILTRVRDRQEAIRRILRKIVDLEPSRRGRMFRLLMVVAGLRRLGTEIEEETKRMPILNDINDHEVLGREYKRGVQQGLQQGVQQGLQQGELRLLTAMLEDRFGELPEWAREKLSGFGSAQLELMGRRVLRAGSLRELFEPEAN
jgi:predicted transposase YdaD